MPLTDKDIVNNILDGNKELFSVLMDKYHNEIFSYIFNITTNYDTTDDLVQEVFLRVYQNLNKYDSNKAKFRTWLYRVCSNYVLNQISKKAYKKNRETMEYQDYMVSTDSTIENDLIMDEQSKKILDIIQSLKKDYRKIALLYYYAGKSVTEINEILNINEKTIYYALKVIVKKIKEEVTHE